MACSTVNLTVLIRLRPFPATSCPILYLLGRTVAKSIYQRCQVRHGFHWTDFRGILYWLFCMNIGREIANLFEIGQKYRTLYVKN